MKNTYNNVYVLTFPNLCTQINKKNKLGYDLLKLRNEQLNNLIRQAHKVIDNIIDQLPDCSHIIVKDSDTIFWVHEHDVKLDIILSDYYYVLNTYTKGIILSCKQYALWNGTNIIYGESILDRIDVAPICKMLFHNAINEALTGDKISVDINSMPPDSYIFNTLSGKKILGSEGILVNIDQSEIVPYQYMLWVKQKLKKWIQ